MLARVYFSQNPVLKFAVEDVLEQLIEDRFYGYKEFDLALIAFSPKVYPIDKRVIDTFNNYLGKNRWIAFHSLSAFANEKVVKNALVVLFIKFTSGGGFEIFSIKNLFQNYRNSIKLTAKYLESHYERKYLHLMFSTFSHGFIGSFVENLEEVLKRFPNIVGGVASGIDTPSFGKITNVYTSEGIIEDGFAMLTLKNVEFGIGQALGYRIIGPIYTITKAEGNRILEIERESVDRLVKRLLRGLPTQDIRIFWYSPIAILDRTEKKISVFRSFKEIPRNKEYLEFYGPIKEGWKFRFSFGLKEELLRASTEEAIKVQNALGEIDVVFNFSCLTRQFILEDLNEEEVQRYSAIFNAPLFGFYTLGEIGVDRISRNLKYNNQTSLIVGVREL